MESPAVKIDPSTRLLLERIQALEDRIFPVGSAPQIVPSPAKSTERQETQPSSPVPLQRPADSLLTLPAVHDATANHVYKWPILQEMLSRIQSPLNRGENYPRLASATDVFILRASSPAHLRSLTESSRVRTWQLFEGKTASLVEIYLYFIEFFFRNVHCFFPLLRMEDLQSLLHTIFRQETEPDQTVPLVSDSNYCLLTMVLCLGSFSCERTSMADRRVSSSVSSESYFLDADVSRHTSELWQKAQLLLGSLTFENTEEAAQCFALVR